MKRMRPVSKGQAHAYIVHHSHLEIFVAEQSPEEAERLFKNTKLKRNYGAFPQKVNRFGMWPRTIKESKGRHYI